MAHEADEIRVAGFAVSIERLVYATVVLMSVLVVYDGWADLTTFAGTAMVIVGPILAITLAHLFAGVLQSIAELHRTLTPAEWGRHIRDQVQVLAAAVPPLVVTGIGWVSPLDARSTIAVLLWTGVLTLMVLSGISGHQAGLRGWRLGASALAGGVVGLVVIAMQVVLKPH